MHQPSGQAMSHIAGCVVSVDPIITVSKYETAVPGGLASLKPEYFEAKPSLHFLGLVSSAELDNAAAIANGLAEIRSRLPQARFVMMANTPLEALAFARVGAPNLLANELIFVDERLFTPAPPSASRAPRYDAVYTARLDPAKRHELAKAVSSLVLTYGTPQAGDVERVRNILPHAVFANHELNAGAYRMFGERGVRDLLIRCGVGLCLSAVEGAMRASLEYRFCGIPVVSTRSLGGRDRYLLGPHVRVVDDNPEAIAQAVAELKSLKFNPLAVREYAGQLVAFDRHNFLLNANKIVERELGVRDRFRSFAPFLRYPVAWRRPEEILAPFAAKR